MTTINKDIAKERTEFLLSSMLKIEKKLAEMTEQKNKFMLGLPCDYDSLEEFQVECDFNLKKLNSIMLEMRFINYSVKYGMSISLN